ncbi:unnamed protein product [Toxocara canis]|uniref:Uncharacterized protein n=1 Tax=Toxocara canis TaxID=6265 RepID=A0A3P7GWY8_TOXCA|nr:unnamed protein product [Toxocara canis]
MAVNHRCLGPDSGGSSDVVEPLPPTLKCTEKSKRKPERRDYQNNGSLKEDANDKNENYFNQPLRNRLDSCNAVQHLIPQSRDLITSTYDNVSVERVMDVDLETNVKETNELNKQHKDDHMADQLSRESRTQSTSPPPQRTAATGRRRGYITGKFIAVKCVCVLKISTFFTTEGRKSLTPIGADVESILVAVIMFLGCGILMFCCCFVVTQIYVCYKQSRIRKKRRMRGEEDEFTFAIMQADGSFDHNSI